MSERHSPSAPPPTDPVLAALAAAPVDDEPETEEERALVVEARAAVKSGDVISHAEIRRRLLG